MFVMMTPQELNVEPTMIVIYVITQIAIIAYLTCFAQYP